MATCKITAHKFQDVHIDLKKALAIRDLELSFDQMQADDEIGKLISFVSLHYHEPNGLLYCGLTSFANQVLISFDPDTKKFIDLEYQSRDICERFDVKIHRSFESDGQGNILMAMAGLHDPKVNPEAEGGRLLRLYPDSGEIEVLGRPMPRDYIQTFAYDHHRRIFYGNGYPLRKTFRFDLDSEKTIELEEDIYAHKSRCDSEGNLWELSRVNTRPIHHVPEEDLEMMRTYFETTDRIPLLYKYNPDDGYQFFDEGLPLVSGGAQTLANGLDVGDGGMYLSTNRGGLYRVDKATGQVDEIAFHPGGRLEGIAYDKNRGLLFLGGGTFYLTHVFVVDVEKRRVITPFWPLADTDQNVRCIIVHDLTVTQRNGHYLVHIGETDNPNRSGYLWECDIQI